MDNLPYRHGRGGKDPDHQAHQAVFVELLEGYHSLKRRMQFLKTGIEAHTTSGDPQLVTLLHTHVKQMHQRFKNNRAIRSWDPVYADLFEYKDQIDWQYKETPEGILTRALAKDTRDNNLIGLLHAHSITIWRFTHKGKAASKDPSPTPTHLKELGFYPTMDVESFSHAYDQWLETMAVQTEHD